MVSYSVPYVGIELRGQLKKNGNYTLVVCVVLTVLKSIHIRSGNKNAGYVRLESNVYLMLIKFIHILMLDLIFHLSLVVDLVLPFAMFGHI